MRGNWVLDKVVCLTDGTFLEVQVASFRGVYYLFFGGTPLNEFCLSPMAPVMYVLAQVK